MQDSPDKTSESEISTPEAAIKWATRKAYEAAEEKDRRRQARQESLVNPHRR